MRRSLAFLLPLFLVACGGNDGFKKAQSAQKVELNPDGTVNDHSRCEYKNRPDREASETSGPGAIQPNVRRVWQIVGQGDDQNKVLVCREIDTNLDGIKDVVRNYNEKGESLHEEADSNYDGKVDTWITFAKGRLAEVDIDNNHDGNRDEWKFYTAGKLARVKRDTNNDGKPDVWEIYRDGQLERMGVDLDGDERVDRWDHDNDVRRRFEDAERKKEEDANDAAEKQKAKERDLNEKEAVAADPSIAKDAEKPIDDPKADAKKTKDKKGQRKPAAKKDQ